MEYIKLNEKGLDVLFSIEIGKAVRVQVNDSADSDHGTRFINTIGKINRERGSNNIYFHQDVREGSGDILKGYMYTWAINRELRDISGYNNEKGTIAIHKLDFKKYFTKECTDMEITNKKEIPECYNCNCELKESDIANNYKYDDELLCESCYENNFFTCEDCNQMNYSSESIYIESESISVCEDCADGNYFKCEDCGKYFGSDDVYTNDGESYCHSCYENGDYSTCDECEAIIQDAIHRGDHTYCDDCAPSADLFNYHSDNGREDLSNGSRFKCGFEVEKEDSNVIGDIDADNLLSETGWAFEEDSSLDSESGYEAISPVLDLMNADQINEQLESVKQYVDADFTDHCGGHIHVSDTKRTPNELLDSITGYLPLLYAMYPQRITRSYSAAYNKKEYRSSHSCALSPHDKTLEFRIFGSPKNTDVVKFRVTLLRLMLLNPCENPMLVLEAMQSKKSELYKLLREVYTADQIEDKMALFIKYAIKYEESTGEDIAAFSAKIGNTKKRAQSVNKMLIKSNFGGVDNLSLAL